MKMTRKEESEVERMCNVSEGIWEEALEQGMEQGVLKGKLESINSLMNSMNLSLEEAMKVLNVPEEERMKFRELVLRSN